MSQAVVVMNHPARPKSWQAYDATAEIETVRGCFKVAGDPDLIREALAEGRRRRQIVQLWKYVDDRTVRPFEVNPSYIVSVEYL